MEKTNPEKIVIILQESAVSSLIKDAGTFVLFAGLLWFNHSYLSGSTLIDIFFLIIVIMWLSGRKSSKVYSGNVEGAKKFLEGKEPTHE